MMNAHPDTHECIEDFEVLGLLGRGGFAEVYEAKWLKAGIFVAIKMIDKTLIRNAGLYKRVREEVSIHQRLSHQSILELYTFFEDEKYIYLVLELCPNGSLQKFLKTKTEFNVLSESDASFVIRQVVEAVQYLHSYKIIHRDLSISNLLLTQDMQIKIADFGLATQLTHSDEKHMTMCGTPNFISPEVASRGSHGREADVWGIGCLLYTLLVGKPPFDTQTVKSTLTRVVMASYDVPSHLSREAKDLIDSLLKKNPKDRLELEKILTHPFIKQHGALVGSGMTSNLTQDSGIHTISSRRDSAFSSDCGFKREPKRTTSECFPRDQRFFANANGTSSRSVEHISASGFRQQQHLMVPRSQSTTPFDYQQNVHLNEHYSGNRPAFSDQCTYDRPNSVFSHSGSLLGNPVRDKTPSLLNQYGNAGGMFRDTGQTADPVDFNGILQTVQTSIANSQAIQSNPTGRVFSSYQQSESKAPIHQQRTKGPIKLIAHRLLPTRYETRNAVLTIQDGGEVCVEFIKKRGQPKRNVVCEVCRISPDGQRIILYEPDAGRVGLAPSHRPPELPHQGTEQMFSFENLPEKHWKKYMYAYKFVELVRAKTPKITFYTDKAKCLLMENLVDFEACFYEGGKVTQSTNDGITLIDAQGNRVNVQSSEQCKELTGGMGLIWGHADESRNHCILLERTLTQLPGQWNFPIIVGRRPQNNTLAGSSSNKENATPQTITPTFATANIQLPGMYTTATTQASSSRDKQITIPGIGVATLTNGEVLVKFNDGSNLLVDGKKQVQYQYENGRVEKFSNSEAIPQAIIEKMQHVPKILKQLMPVLTSKPRNFRT